MLTPGSIAPISQRWAPNVKARVLREISAGTVEVEFLGHPGAIYRIRDIGRAPRRWLLIERKGE